VGGACSSVRVIKQNGRPYAKARVRLDFGLLGGQTPDYHTDDTGLAIIHHSHIGEAIIYVSGINCGTFKTPGTLVVNYKG
jgi:hypothetical protein